MLREMPHDKITINSTIIVGFSVHPDIHNLFSNQYAQHMLSHKPHMTVLNNERSRPTKSLNHTTQ